MNIVAFIGALALGYWIGKGMPGKEKVKAWIQNIKNTMTKNG